jgi:predicted nucleotidyltransferase
MKAIPTDRTVEEFASRVRKLLATNLVHVHWFGSRSRGEGNADSDVDLLVETERALTPGERDMVADISIDLAAEFGCLLDVHYYTRSELHRPPYSRTPFVHTVMEEGIAV